MKQRQHTLRVTTEEARLLRDLAQEMGISVSRLINKILIAHFKGLPDGVLE